MNDFNYQKKAVEFDRHLETVMASHTSSTSPKVASPDDAPLGLQQYIERPSISEEIEAIRSKAASVETDINIIRASEKVASIAEERASRFDDFSALTKPVVEDINKVAAAEGELEARRQELRQG